jgi:hypothetical protein
MDGMIFKSYVITSNVEFEGKAGQNANTISLKQLRRRQHYFPLHKSNLNKQSQCAKYAY